MKLTPYKIVTVTEFEEGDFLCHSSNWEYAYSQEMPPQFFRATVTDASDYSGINGEYYKIVTNNKNRR